MDIKKILLFIASLSLVGCGGNNNDPKPTPEPIPEKEEREMHNYPVYTNGVDFDLSNWQKPEFKFDSSMDKHGDKAVYIRSDYDGNESYAFAYLGIPSSEKPKDGYPAILLLHGGGGSAYTEWVNFWRDKGFVALAVDLEGHVPKKTGKITDYPQDLYENSIYKAPHNTNLGDPNEDLTKTWLHYACRTAIICNSYLHSLEEVNKQEIGISGISWGGFITSIITGYDDRFAFSIPIYCTVNMKESGTPIGGYIKHYTCFEVFDNYEPFIKINTPIKFICSDVDAHNNIITASELMGLTKNGSLSIIHGFLHSHLHAYNLEEAYVFACEAIKGNYKFKINFLSKTDLSLDLAIGKEAKFGLLFQSEETKITKDSKWSDKEIDLSSVKDNKITIKLKEGTKYHYVTFIDERGANHTSLIQYD